MRKLRSSEHRADLKQSSKEEEEKKEEESVY
jgi:hypothetical protein